MFSGGSGISCLFLNCRSNFVPSSKSFSGGGSEWKKLGLLEKLDKDFDGLEKLDVGFDGLLEKLENWAWTSAVQSRRPLVRKEGVGLQRSKSHGRLH